MEIDVVISGERDVAARFEALPARLHQHLVQRIGGLTARLAADARSRAPSRTGKLRSEIAEHVEETADLVRGRVTVDTGGDRNERAKAGALEYGAHRSVAVRAFARSGHTPLGAAAEQAVAAYTRRTNIVEERYMRSALDDLRGEAKAALEEALAGL